MVKRRQRDAGAGSSMALQDGADCADEADRQNAAYSRRVSAVEKLQRYAREEEAVEESGSGQEQGAEEEIQKLEGDTDEEGKSGAEGGGQKAEKEKVKVTEEQEEGEPTLMDVFKVVSFIKNAMASLTQGQETLKKEMAGIRESLKKADTRMEAVEERVGAAEDHLNKMQKIQSQHSQKIAEVSLKNDDLENRSRRNNIRIVGLPEKSEGNDPTVFIEKWLLNKFGEEHLSRIFAVERAHRVPMRPLPPGSNPRTLLARILNCRDRDTILRRARLMKDLTYNGQRIELYPDYSAEVQKLRMRFSEGKKKLRELGVSYSTLYPAKLRVVALGTTHFFTNPEDVLKWLEVNRTSIISEKEAGK